jgi:Large ribosomal RNA subunit accumulation protein YceD
MTEGAFSRPIVVDALPEGGETAVSFTADAQELLDLARWMGLPDLAEFVGDFRLLRRARGRVTAQGELRARMTRVCVVTLEPFETELTESVSLEFAPQAEAEAAAEPARVAHEPLPGQSLVDLPDPPDPIIDGRIDLGAVSAEFLSLGLDPHPRKPGVDFHPPEVESTAEESPFAALGRLPQKPA